jgi:hypothetical protein
MKEALLPDSLEKKRGIYTDRFCKNLMDALFFPKSSQEVIT